MSDPGGEGGNGGDPRTRAGAPPRKSGERKSGPKPSSNARRPTESPPPVRPAAPDGPPPALRPRGADATIPLLPPDPKPRMRTPVPDLARSGRTPDPPRTVRSPPPEQAAPARPPAVDLASDAPQPERPPTPAAARPAPPLDGGPRLASDDEILDGLGESISPDFVPDGFGEVEPAPKPTPVRRRGLLARWLSPPEDPEPGRTTSRLSRHLSYEIVVVAVTFFIASVLLFTSFDGEIGDAYVKGRELVGGYPATTSGQVTLVTVGEEALYLWDPASGPPEITPRAMLGELVAVLDEAGASVIVLDFLLDVPAPGDERLAEAAAAHGAVIAAERFVVTDPATGGHFAAGPSPAIGDDVVTGFANLGEEALWTSAEERLVRSAPLVEVIDRARLQSAWPASVGQPQAEGEITPHMALLAAWQFTHPDGSPDQLMAELGAKCQGEPLSCDISLADLGLPAGPSLVGRTPINFRGPEHADGLPTLRASALLRLAGEPAMYRMAGVDKPLEVPDWLREHVSGRIVVVGRVDAQAGDRFATPYGFPVPVHTDMDGARIQAQLIDTLLTGRHVRRAPAWTMWLLAALLLVGLAITARYLREDVHTGLVLLTGTALVVVGTLVFIATDGFVLDVTTPLTALLLGLVGVRLRGWAID